jgi:hypothetical protein
MQRLIMCVDSRCFQSRCWSLLLNPVLDDPSPNIRENYSNTPAVRCARRSRKHPYGRESPALKGEAAEKFDANCNGGSKALSEILQQLLHASVAALSCRVLARKILADPRNETATKGP